MPCEHVQDNPGIPAVICGLDQTAVALLIDTSAPDAASLEDSGGRDQNHLPDIRTLYPVEFISGNRSL